MIKKMKRTMAFALALTLIASTFGNDVNVIGTYAAEEVLVEEIGSDVLNESVEEPVEEVLECEQIETIEEIVEDVVPAEEIVEEVVEAPVEEVIPVEANETPVSEEPITESEVVQENEEQPVEEVMATEEVVTEETPVEEVPAEETPVEETPVEEVPAEETPVEEAPVEEAPVDGDPVEEAPAEEVPAETVPEETPAEEVVEENTDILIDETEIITDEEKEEEFVSEEITGSNSYKSVSVSVVAPEGAFPKGTELSITPVENKEVENTLNDASSAENVSGYVAFDITFSKDGEELSPREGYDVSVKFTVEPSSEIITEEASTMEVVHIENAENNEADVIQ
nr:hypothetical protein [Butyrivibrio sp.]